MAWLCLPQRGYLPAHNGGSGDVLQNGGCAPTQVWDPTALGEGDGAAVPVHRMAPLCLTALLPPRLSHESQGSAPQRLFPGPTVTSQPWARSCCIKGSCRVFLLIRPLGKKGSREVALSLCKLLLSSSWCSFRICISPHNALCWMLSTLSMGRGLSSLLSLGNGACRNRNGTSVFEAVG